MSIDLTESPGELAFALAETIESLDPYLNPFILEQDTEPSQSDWETAWVVAGNTLPIPEDQELYWKTGETIRGQFGCTNDRFYCIFPNNSVSLGGVTHFAYTKFLGWEDEQHFLFSGTQLNDAGQYVGLLRAYLDGTLEQVDFTGFTANTLLGYDEAQGKLWYIEGTDLKRIDTTTEAITVIASGITVEPTTIAFDGAGDAFCTINIGAGLDVYRWNNTGATFTSIKVSITVNGVGEDPGQVITASLNYVVVLTSVANYWVQFARSGGAEVQIKSNPAGATADNLPQPAATAWTQILASRSLDILSIVYTELTGTPSISEWRRTVLWNMATSSYSEVAELPYDDFMSMCISEAPSAEVLDHRRDIIYHGYTLSYRKPSGTAWEYHNVSGLRPNNSLTRQILETDDGQIFVLSEGSSGKIWRLSAWDQGEADAVVLGIVNLTGVVSYLDGANSYISFGFVDVSQRPKGYNLLEISFNSGLSNDLAAIRTGNLYDEGVPIVSGGIFDNSVPGIRTIADNNSYLVGSMVNPIRATANASAQGSFNQIRLFEEVDDMLTHAVFLATTDNSGIVNETVSASNGGTVTLKSVFPEFSSLYVRVVLSVAASGITHLGGYFMIRALRTEGRRQGGSYYAPAMA